MELAAKITVNNSNFTEIAQHYENFLNKQEIGCSNDETTPLACVEEMISKIPQELWIRDNLKILDPCCGNGNFFIPITQKLLETKEKKEIFEDILHFNDTNKQRLANVKEVFCDGTYSLNISNNDYLKVDLEEKFDLIVANPPYAKFQKNGARSSKNHNLIASFLEKSLEQLKPSGYLLYLTPDNWMSLSNRNTLISKLTALQIIHLDIHTAKKYFKKIGSSFTWYVIQNRPYTAPFTVSGVWKKAKYESRIESMVRDFVPLLYTQTVKDIFSKTVDSNKYLKYPIQTSSDLHRFTKKALLSKEETNIFKYKTIHTPKQTVFSSRPHKFHKGYKVLISLTDKYKVFVENNCGMTQSTGFLLCDSKQSAENTALILSHPLYVFLNNVCRYGNFNNTRVLQRLPVFTGKYSGNLAEIYAFFGLSLEEIQFIENNL